MIRTLLATTALTAVLTGAAFAQAADVKADANGAATTANDTVKNTKDAAADNSMQADAKTNVKADAKAGDTNAPGYFQATADEVLASNIMGKTVYNGTADDADAIGDVSDIVLAPDGQAEAVVIGVGGFLGIGEKQVAVDFSHLDWVQKDNDTRLIMDTTADALENAPSFDRTRVTGEGNTLFGQGRNNRDANTNVNVENNAVAPAPAPADNANANVETNDNAMAPAPAGDANNAVVATGGQAQQNLTEVDSAQLSADNLIGTRVFSTENKDIGEINDVIVSADGQVTAYIVDVGGFLGMGEKPVALGAKDLKVMQDDQGNISIHTGFTKEQLEQQPEYSEDAYAKDPGSVVLR